MKPTKPRPTGRPPLDPDSPSVPITVRVSSKQYDALWRAAMRDRQTVAQHMRRLLIQDDTGDPSE